MKKYSQIKLLSFFIAFYSLFVLIASPLLAAYQPPRGYPQPAPSNKESLLYIPLSAHSTLQINTKGRETEKNILIKDYLASTRVITNETGGVVTENSFYPYGQIKSATTGNQPTDKQFTGHRKMEGSNVYHAGGRFYSPSLGVFVQPDPIQGLNRYAYVSGNPVAFNDPSGNLVGNKPAFYSEFQGVRGSIWQEILAHFNQATGAGSVLQGAGWAVDRGIGMTPDHPNYGTGALSRGGKDLNSLSQQFVSGGDALEMEVALGMVGMGINTVKPLTGAARAHQVARARQAMKAANDWYDSSRAVEIARRGYIEQASKKYDLGVVHEFFDAMKYEGVTPVVDEAGRYVKEGMGLYTNEENLIRTIDEGARKLFIIHPSLNEALLGGNRWGFEEIYRHGFHDFALLRLGYHTPGHTFQGVAGPAHLLDYKFQISLGLGYDGYDNLARGEETFFRNFGFNYYQIND